MSSIDLIYRTHTGPGVLLLSNKNSEIENFFDDIVINLYEFYKEQGLIFVSRLFDKNTDKYYFPVYRNNVMSSSSIAYINFRILLPERNVEFVPEWDFPHAPFVYNRQKAWTYFNSSILPQTIQREEFYDFIQTVPVRD